MTEQNPQDPSNSSQNQGASPSGQPAGQNQGQEQPNPRPRRPVEPGKPVSPPPPPGYPPPPAYAATPAPSGGRDKQGGMLARVVTGLATSILLVSLLANAYFVFLFAQLTTGPSEASYQTGQTGYAERVVILPVVGLIDNSTAKFVRSSLDSLAQEGSRPAAVVLRVESPGGGVSASDRIWNDVKAFQDETNIPIVASFGSMATSGGYYVSASADYIMAEPTGITGSIGVIAQSFTVHEMLEKIGINPHITVAEGSPKKDMLSTFRDWDEQDKAALRSILNAAYDRFVEVVADGRQNQLSPEQVRSLATGEVYTTPEAVDNKLVDAEGYLDDAIEYAAKDLAKLKEEPQVTIMQPPASFGLGGLMSRASGRSAELPEVSPAQVRRWMAELTTPRLEYRFALPSP